MIAAATDNRETESPLSSLALGFLRLWFFCYRRLRVETSSEISLVSQNWISISLINDSNKENPHLVNAAPAKIESIDVSLAEELSAICQKIERLRLDREKTEKMPRERHLVMEANLKEMVKRGEVHKLLEIEADRLFWLKELKSSYMVRKCLFGYSENASSAEEEG
ncbi:hypothetical protein TEA_006895 [Camellia sinensis var. sinensis]|uniref:Uncharacterized protein n=1 Tax=Camellia sinensis var. sinensis TaxID=542762 RepID=A0A4S4DD20_CAMSN|nr:hypothetical protein TEA_006895 [Camellia sinensis var. sinensis]